jgi:diaminopimelate epimerase
MDIPFSKYSGCGNDFILIDNRQQIFNKTCSEFIAHLCRRRLGIGADGIILLEHSASADFCMRIFNADGSEAEMCGNGLRCLIRFIRDLRIDGDKFIIETMHQHIPTAILEDSISAEMPFPTNICFFTELDIEGKVHIFHCLDTGVPHAVLFVEDLNDNKWMAMAPKIRHHPKFMPKGTNVNFATINSNNEVEVRTFERGVEGETLACGTGAAAVAFAAANLYELDGPITIRPKSGDIILIDVSTSISNPNSRISKAQSPIRSFNSQDYDSEKGKIIMTGPAYKIFSGTIHPYKSLFF